MANRLGTVAGAAALLGLLVGCAGEAGVVVGDSRVADSDTWSDPGDLGHIDHRTVYACDTVDVLFVVDNSNSMEQEQKNLATNFTSFITAIEAIQPPIKSYHVGVISTDVGAGPYSGPLMGSCTPDGDAGKLQHAPKPGKAGCKASYPRYLQGPGPDVAKDFACIAELGLGGCGYEQQFEAALQALASQPYNAGFIRKNAPLAIIFVTDEDDCSASDDKLFDPDDSSLGPYPARCVTRPGKLHPVDHYVKAFKKLKDDDRRLVVGAITGPTGKIEVDKVTGKVTPACSSPAFGSALPGNRFDKLIKAFGDRGVHASLCQGDLAKPLGVIGKAIERVCLE